jgi:hypothetical protein
MPQAFSKLACLFDTGRTQRRIGLAEEPSAAVGPDRLGVPD